MTVTEVRKQARATGLLPKGGPVVVMVSGGRDSVCLLDVTVALCGPGGVTALHVNYGLRAEAHGDESHCRELCRLLGVGLEIVQASREERAKGNLHAWAREKRYEAAMRLAERLERHAGGQVVERDAGGQVERDASGQVERDASGQVERDAGGQVAGDAASGHTVSVATGHTATDQVETILYRLAASPGRRALLGMSAREGRLIRPLLGIAREQTAAYCLERGLTWREDASNDSERYARARVRHGLVKALDTVHPAARANILRTAELLREETELLEALVDAELLDELVNAEPPHSQGIAIERLRKLPPALQRLVVIRLAENVAGTFVPQAGERVAEILTLDARGGRAELHLGGLVGAVIERGELHMARIQPREQHRQGECEAGGPSPGAPSPGDPSPGGRSPGGQSPGDSSP